jgi:hypothetical protein
MRCAAASLLLAGSFGLFGQTELPARDRQRFASAHAVNLQFAEDIPGRGVFADAVRRVTRAFGLYEAPAAESDLAVIVKARVLYSHRTWNGAGAQPGQLLTTKISSEGTITARLLPKGPEITQEFACASGMPLAPALIESPFEIDPAPSVEQVSECIARHVSDLLSPLLQRERRPEDTRDVLAQVTAARGDRYWSADGRRLRYRPVTLPTARWTA